MKHQIVGAILLVAALASVPAWTKKKEKQLLPEVVLRAQTVYVTILPGAKEPLTDPSANLKTVEEVEKALMKWGRLRLVTEADSADLVIGVQKGTGKAASPTISGGPIDSRPVSVETTDNQVRVAAQRGQPPPATQTPDTSAQDGRTHTGTQFGGAEDTLEVHLGNSKYPLDSAPVWRYTAKDALKPPDVPAVEQFKKAVEESGKAAHKKQPLAQNPQGQQQPEQQGEEKRS